MAVDLPALEFLLKCNHVFGPFNKTLLLGRQNLLIPNDFYRSKAAQILENYNVNFTLEAINQGTADNLFIKLGSNPFHVLDVSAYEGANVVHNLNEPISSDLYNSYDTVVDIGVLEHVFNLPVAFSNIMQLLNHKGRFICVNIANNHLGHGFWQFSPEAFLRSFSKDNGFETKLIYLHAGKLIEVTDPNEAGRRLPLKTDKYTYILYAAEKISDVKPFHQWPSQSDYDVSHHRFLIKTCLQNQGIESALALAESFLAKNPLNPNYYEMKAELMWQKGQNDTALKLYEKSCELAPDNISLRIAAARAFQRASLPEQALQHWQYCAEQNPSNPMYAEQVTKTQALIAKLKKSPSAPSPSVEVAAKLSDGLPPTSKTVENLHIGWHPSEATSESLKYPPGHPMRVLPVTRNLFADKPAEIPLKSVDKQVPAKPQEWTDTNTAFTIIEGFKIRTDCPQITPPIFKALMNKRYEFRERQVIKQTLAKGDRVLELGSGMGVVSLVIASQVGDDNIYCVEANPEAASLARYHFDLNNHKIKVFEQLLYPKAIKPTESTIELNVSATFVESSIHKLGSHSRKVPVPVADIESIVEQHQLNVLVTDIEGFETSLVEHFGFNGINKYILELHPAITGEEAVLEIIRQLNAKGLHINTRTWFADVAAFCRNPTQTHPALETVLEMFKYFWKARKNAVNGELSAAIQSYEKILMHWPENALIATNLGQLYRQIGEIDHATNVVLPLAGKTNWLIDLELLAAELMLSKNNLEQALSHGQHAVYLQPESHLPWFILAKTYKLLKINAKARESAEQALSKMEWITGTEHQKEAMQRILAE